MTLRDVEARLLMEREQLMQVRGKLLPFGNEGRGGSRTDAARAETDVHLERRAERVAALRAEGMTWPEVAASLGLPVRVVHYALNRSRERARVAMRREATNFSNREEAP